jgi:quinol-cytochrome oxidoreductase complex cytochrome b subunit
MNLISIIILIFALVTIIIGILIVAGSWNPFVKKEEGKEKEPLTRKEKMVAAGFFTSIFLTLLTLLFSSNPSWLEKLRRKNGLIK